jgi:hypothetical protein
MVSSLGAEETNASASIKPTVFVDKSPANKLHGSL